MTTDRFPWTLKTRRLSKLSDRQIIEHQVGNDDRVVLDKAFDIVIWPEVSGSYTVSGRAVKGKTSLQNASSVGGQVLRLLAERHLTPRGRTPNGSAVSFQEIDDLKDPKVKQTRGQIIFGIHRILEDEDAKRVLPNAVRGVEVYKFADEANIAIVQD